ncbi:MAG: carbohydrate ABC transporter permease [Synergistaceae bacterium]|jgi:sn-glycerol 3-phosphate transport system permease protein|nr:carbohydrate ABC transporter permease [Synergistaceae bacterium]
MNGGFMRAAARAAGFTALILIFVFPMFFMVSASFMSRYEVNMTPPALLPSEFHPENYATAWSRMNFVHYLRNSLLSTFITIAGQLVVCVPCAYAFAKKQFRFKKTLYCLVLFDLIVPAQTIFLQIYILESRIGWINTMRGLTAPFFYSAFTIFSLVQYFRTIPDEILDAARLDGCSEIRVITHIMAPMARPIIITAMIFTFVYKWNDYFWTSILTTDEAVRTLPMAVQNLMPVGHSAREWHIIMAGNVMALVPMLAVYVLANRAIKSGLIFSGRKDLEAPRS